MPRVTDYSFLAEQYRQHADKVFKRCLIMSGGDAAWAQEVTHDVFIRLMEKSDSLDRSTSLAGWLLTIAYRLCANRLRHERTLWRRVQAVLMSSTETAAPEPESQSDVHALGVKLQSALATLPPKQRAVLVMRHLDGMAQTEIAKTLDCSEGYVSKLLDRATRTLRGLDWEVDDV
jgi:RNA polymerase sigma-70 factor (ECF subfamily)